jgi:hypothetical protein
MEKTEIEERSSLVFNYEDMQLPRLIRMFHPAVYRREQGYYCVVKDNSEQTQLTGQGETPMLALLNLDKNIKDYIVSNNDQDDFKCFILAALKDSKKIFTN